MNLVFASFSMSVQQAERAWESLGYTVRFKSREVERFDAHFNIVQATLCRVELEHPSHRGDFTAGEGASDLEAIGNATLWELRRMRPLQEKLWYEAAEDQGGVWK